MDCFSISNIYEKNGLKTVDINPLPVNYCSFDCVFCPLGRTAVKTDKPVYFKETKGFLIKLVNFLKDNRLDLVFINSNGEGLANSEIRDIINVIKDKNIKVKLLSNGYILNNSEYRDIIEMCDEVIGELSLTNEKDFQTLHRPLEGYTLNQYVTNLAEFRKWYKGKFILNISIIKNYSDSNESLEIFKKMIEKISPDEVFFETPDNDRFKGAFQVSKERMAEIERI